jgi:hypothetical protein
MAANAEAAVPEAAVPETAFSPAIFILPDPTTATQLGHPLFKMASNAQAAVRELLPERHTHLTSTSYPPTIPSPGSPLVLPKDSHRHEPTT